MAVTSGDGGNGRGRGRGRARARARARASEGEGKGYRCEMRQGELKAENGEIKKRWSWRSGLASRYTVGNHTERRGMRPRLPSILI